MRSSILLATSLVLIATAAAGLAACGGAGDAGSPAPSPTASPRLEGAPSSAPATGTKMAPGLYDLEGGAVVAVGTVEHRDLEGGFWVVIGGTEAGWNAGEVVAVIANGDEFAGQFEDNQGLSFEIYGERAGDASSRMAGPEITARRVVLAADGGPAE